MRLLEKIIREANGKGRIALVPFLTAGFPDKEKFWDTLRNLAENGADIIEIGVPFSDPVADGPTVETASRRALDNGVNLGWILEGLREHKDKIESGIVLMGYYNPYLQYGLEKLAHDARMAGVDGFIVPDLPLEEQAPLKMELDKHDISLIQLVGPNTSRERMLQYAQFEDGYVYVVSILGTTGERDNLQAQIAQTIERAKKCFNVPIALGFGLKNPGQLAALKLQPDAAVFGSALLKHLEAGGSVKEFMDVWTAS